MGGRVAYNIGWMGDEKSSGFTYASRFSFAAWQKCFGLVNVMDGKSVVTKVLGDERGFFLGGRRY